MSIALQWLRDKRNGDTLQRFVKQLTKHTSSHISKAEGRRVHHQIRQDLISAKKGLKVEPFSVDLSAATRYLSSF